MLQNTDDTITHNFHCIVIAGKHFVIERNFVTRWEHTVMQ
jgi:hypothetical protein